MLGTSKEIRIRLLQNLSERMIAFGADTLQNMHGNVDDVNGDRGKCLTLLILWKISDN